jgi:hypothetical protein
VSAFKYALKYIGAAEDWMNESISSVYMARVGALLTLEDE